MTGRLAGVRATYVVYVTSIVVGLAIWEVIARQLPRIIIAPPSVVGVNLFQGFASGELALAFAGSLAHLCIGFAIAVCVGIPLGFLVGRNRTAFYLLDPTISGIYAVPPIAFVPFMIIWFGLFFEARVALVFLMSFIEILVTVSAGARGIESSYLDVARGFGARGRDALVKVMFPAVLPFVFTGLRIGLVRAIHAMIVAELFFAAVNLGDVMENAALRFDTGALLAVVVLLAVFGLLVQELLKEIEARVIPWHVRT